MVFPGITHLLFVVLKIIGQRWLMLACASVQTHHCLRCSNNQSLEFFLFCFLFDSLRPINNLSVIKGRVFLGFNQYKARINVSSSRTLRSAAGEARTRGPSVSSQALYH